MINFILIKPKLYKLESSTSRSSKKLSMWWLFYH